MYLLTITLLVVPFVYNLKDEEQLKRTQYVQAIQKEKAVEESLRAHLPKLDSLSKKILRYNVAVKASFIDNEIQYGLKDLQVRYNNAGQGKELEILNHAYELYDLLFLNRRELGGNIRDIERLKSAQEDCKFGTQQLKESLIRQQVN